MQRRNVNRLVQRFLRLWRGKQQPKAKRLQEEKPTIRLPATYQQAAARLVDPERCRALGHRNKVRGNQKFEGMHPDMLAFYKAFQRELDRRQFPFFPFEFVRTYERQAELFAQGRTRARPGQSPHQHGCAFDLVHSERFWDLTGREWDVIGAIGKEVARKLHIEVEWGGNWSFYDPAHWQLKDWRLWVYHKPDNQPWPVLKTQQERDKFRAAFKKQVKLANLIGG